MTKEINAASNYTLQINLYTQQSDGSYAPSTTSNNGGYMTFYIYGGSGNVSGNYPTRSTSITVSSTYSINTEADNYFYASCGYYPKDGYLYRLEVSNGISTRYGVTSWMLFPYQAENNILTANIYFDILSSWEQLAEPFTTDSTHTGDDWDHAYEIRSAEQLAYIAKQVNSGATTYKDKYFKQTANIKLGGYEWVPIGTDLNYSFCGNYDGQNYKIEGVVINAPEKGRQGLFGVAQGEIRNVILQSGRIIGDWTVGGIVGESDGTVTNCKNYAHVEGVFGVGGIAGYLEGLELSNCVNYGSIVATADSYYSDSEVGGICGGIAMADHLKNCINYGEITGNLSCVGGVFGYIETDYTIVESCVNYGIVNASSGRVGGVAGYTCSDLIDCASYGHIQYSGTNSDSVGAVCGLADGSGLTACFFNGTSNVSLGIVGSGSTTACYLWCNKTKQIYGTIDEIWLNYWAVVPNINDGLPIQKDMLAIAEVADTTVDDLKTAFRNHGFDI